AGNGYTLRATAGAIIGTSAPFNVTSGNVPTKLAFTTQPPASSQATASCTVAAVGGVATFNGVQITTAATGYTLRAQSGSLTQDISISFDITAGAATQLVLTSQPQNVAPNTTLTPAVVVKIEDMFNNVVNSNANVSLALNPAGGNLQGTTTVADVSVQNAGNGDVLNATSGGLGPTPSSPFNVQGAGTAAKLAFTTQPTTTVAGSAIADFVVTIQDVNGNAVAGATNSITIAFKNNAGGGALSGTLTQIAVNGSATFTGISINKSATGYTLKGSSAGLTDATSAGFDITPGAATHFGFTQSPVDTTAGQTIFVTVAAQDANNNTDPTFAGNVTIAINSGPGGAVLGGTAVKAASS